jgi:hypothetical protein
VQGPRSAAMEGVSLSAILVIYHAQCQGLIPPRSPAVVRAISAAKNKDVAVLLSVPVADNTLLTNGCVSAVLTITTAVKIAKPFDVPLSAVLTRSPTAVPDQMVYFACLSPIQHCPADANAASASCQRLPSRRSRSFSGSSRLD